MVRSLMLILAAVIGLTAQAAMGECLELIPADGSPLPPDAAVIVEGYERGAIETRARAEAIIEADRRTTIAKLDQLARACESTGRADDAAAIRGRIATLEAVAAPQPQPSTNLAAFRGQHGKVLTLTVTGAGGGYRGSVWGDGVYTDDSSLGAAAVHAGVLVGGETGQVTVTILPGQNSYTGSSRHGIASMSYGPWPGSYHIARANGADPREPRPDDLTPVRADQPNRPADREPTNLREFRDRVGQRFTFTVTGTDSGTIWGDKIYTDDSDLATAAVHAGILAVGQTGPVVVTVLPGQAAYTGAKRNGIVSASYSNWSGSYRIERVKVGDNE